MPKKIGNKMKEFDMNDLLLPEINLMKYINQSIMLKFLPRNVYRMVEALTIKGEYVLDGVILKKNNKDLQESTNVDPAVDTHEEEDNIGD